MQLKLIVLTAFTALALLKQSYSQDSCTCRSSNTAELFRKTFINAANDAPVVKTASVKLQLTLTSAREFHRDFGSPLVNLLAFVFMDATIKRVAVAHRINFLRTIKDVRHEKKEVTLSTVVEWLNHSFLNERFEYDETFKTLYVQGNRADPNHTNDLVKLLACILRKKYGVQVAVMENLHPTSIAFAPIKENIF